MKTELSIGDRRIGTGHPPYVIAEMSGNHNGSLDRALEILSSASEAGADAVKLQTYTADTMTIDHDGADFMVKGGLWDGYTLYKLYDWAHTPWEWHKALFARGKELGITVFSTPFDETAVDFLEGLDAPAYKIASFEMVDLALIECVAATGKPMIISTGMANLEEIGEALETARKSGSSELALLHCVSGYPTPVEESNLMTLVDLAERFKVPVGLSDHTLGTVVPVAATALGACLIEKHVTIKRADGGPDAAFSLEPEELARLVDETHQAWQALGQVNYERTNSESDSVVFRRSLYAVKDIAAGEVLSGENVRSIRPGYGLPPGMLTKVIGCRASQAIRRGQALQFSMVDLPPDQRP